MDKGRTMISLAISVLFVASSMSVLVCAFGADQDGYEREKRVLGSYEAIDGTYIPIISVADLLKIGSNDLFDGSNPEDTRAWTLDAKYYLNSDIIFPAPEPGMSNHIPIGGPGAGHEFAGTFNGNGKTISGMVVIVDETASDAYAGLFGVVGGANLYDINMIDGLVKVETTGEDCFVFAGGIVAVIGDSATIDGCYNNCEVTAKADYSAAAGGIVGAVNNMISNGTVTINNCYNSGNISAAASAAGAGGMVGAAEMPPGWQVIIDDCHNTGNIMTGSITLFNGEAYAGGIIGAGWCDITVANCHNEGTVTSDAIDDDVVSFDFWPEAYAGGIAGYITAVEGCYNTGSVEATSEDRACAGGISSTAKTVDGCYNTGSVKAISSAGGAYAGGIVCGAGMAYETTTINNCYNKGDITASGFNASVGGIASVVIIGDIMNCYNTGSVEATSEFIVYAGGIVGVAMLGEIMNCYNTGSVKASADELVFAGGIVGAIDVAEIYSIEELFYFVADSKIENCYNIGSVEATADATFVGGIVGTANTVGIMNAGDLDAIAGVTWSVSYQYVDGKLEAIIEYDVTVLYIRDGADISDLNEIIIDIMKDVSLSVSYCYFLEGIGGDICGFAGRLTTLDGGESLGDQRSGEKVATGMRMAPPAEGSVYYVGEDDEGWDFEGVWMIDPVKNGGYPILRSLAGSVAEGTLVSSITVTGAGGAAAIVTNSGTLQMSASVLPGNASDSTVMWSVINGTGTATISSGGLLTASTNGTVTVRATANDGSGVYGEKQITISGQTVTPTTYALTVSGGSGSGNYTAGQSVTITATVPAGKQFNGWTSSNGGSFANASGSSTVFTMPANAVTVTATYTDAPAPAENGDDNTTLGIDPMILAVIIAAAAIGIAGVAFFFLRKS